MIAALAVAGALATFTSTTTQAVSGTTLATLISGDGSATDLLILWRGSPGWLLKPGGGGGGGFSSGAYSGTIHYGDLELDYEVDFDRRIVQISGTRVDLRENNVILVDDADSKAGPRIAKVMTIPADALEDIPSAIRTSPELVSYIRCDTRMADEKLQMAADMVCGVATGHYSRTAGELYLRMGLAAYAQAVRTMDHARTAALFAADGELVNPGREPIRGPEAIEAFLKTSSDHKVLDYQIVPGTTTVDGDTGTQAGSYHQKVEAPDGHVIDVGGTFSAAWTVVDGKWRITRMETHPSQ